MNHARELAILDALAMIEANARSARENLALLRALSTPRLALAGENPQPDPGPVRNLCIINVNNVVGHARALAGVLSNEQPAPDDGPKLVG